jgi:hypothetical protein
MVEPHGCPPPQATDDAVFRNTPTSFEPTRVNSFTGTLKIGFINIASDQGEVNISILLNRCLSCALKMDKDFRILPLDGFSQRISILTSYQPLKRVSNFNKVVKDGIRGKINVAMSKSIGDFKNQDSSFRHYLNKEKNYVSFRRSSYSTLQSVF